MRLLVSVLALLVVCGVAQAQTVVLVRHAERAAEPASDPVLTEAGEARARALAATLVNAHVSAILTSPLQRTIRTAAPLAVASGVSPRVVSFDRGEAAHVAAIVAAARAAPTDSTVVVVGHSNTVPAIARALGHAAAAAIPECRFDTLIVLRLGAEAPGVVEARYGAPSAGC